MYRNLINIIALLFFITKLVAQNQVFELKGTKFQIDKITKKKDTIHILRNNISETEKPTLIFLQGSLPIPLLFRDNQDIFPNIPFDYKELSKKWNIILIARKGVPLIGQFPNDANGVNDSEGHEPMEYRKHNHIYYRVWQAKTVIDYLYHQKYVDKKSIYVMGHSEGYRVGAKLATSTNKIAKIVLANTSPFTRTAHEIQEIQTQAILTKKHEEAQNKIDSLLTDYHQYDGNIEKHRNNFDIYGWLSYERNQPIKYFQKIKIPFLIIGGTNDVRSTQNQLLPFLVKNNNMQLKMFPGYDHNFFKEEWDAKGNPLESTYHWDDVFQYCFDWFLKNHEQLKKKKSKAPSNKNSLHADKI